MISLSHIGNNRVERPKTEKLTRYGFARVFERSAEYRRLYVIGDIHGRFDLFRKALRAIANDNAQRSSVGTSIILLGDVIDRGPSSRELLTLLPRIQAENPAFFVLRGNHEDMLVQSASGNASAQQLWLRNGARHTLLSLSIDPDAFSRSDPAARALELTEALGEANLRWLATRPYYMRSGDYFFSHAGIRPGVKLGKQPLSALMWGGREFLESERDHGAVVVHGHSEVLVPEFKFNRINIDTAAYRTGRLTILVLEGSARWTLTAQ